MLISNKIKKKIFFFSFLICGTLTLPLIFENKLLMIIIIIIIIIMNNNNNNNE